jgi:hypothetical protein
LTKVYERCGPEFIEAMLTDPEARYPGQRRMVLAAALSAAGILAFFYTFVKSGWAVGQVNPSVRTEYA